jgi:hypothetical protein
VAIGHQEEAYTSSDARAFVNVPRGERRLVSNVRRHAARWTSSPDGMRRVTGSAATVPANTTTLTVVKVR